MLFYGLVFAVTFFVAFLFWVTSHDRHRSRHEWLPKEMIAMRDGHLVKRISREFAKALTWTLVLFGSLVTIFVSSGSNPPLDGVAFISISLVVVAAIVAVLEL